MNEPLQVILAKTSLTSLQLHIGKSGLSIDDPADLRLMEDGQIGVLATLTRYRFGIFPYKANALVGLIPPQDRDYLLPHMANIDSMRVRIVTLTPEHLSVDHRPELAISVWGIMRFVRAPTAPRTQVKATPTPAAQEAPPPEAAVEPPGAIPPPPPFRKASAR